MGTDEREGRAAGAIQSVARASALLQCFVGSDESLSLTELAQRTGLTVSTAYRLLQTLCAERLLGRDRHGERYVRGPVLLALAQSSYVGAGLVDAQRAVDDLMLDTGASASLGIRDESCVVVLLSAKPAAPLHFDRPAGTRVPLLQSAMGRVLLAFEPGGAGGSSTALARLGPTTPSTSTPTKLRHVLRSVEDLGYSLVDQEQHVGVRSIAVPITDTRGVVCAAIGIQGPLIVVSDDRVTELAARAAAAAREVERLPNRDLFAPRLG